MAHHEQTSLPRVLNPLISIVTQQEVNFLRIVIVGIHEFESDTDSDARERAKQDVSEEEDFGLLPEKLFVVPESVDVHLGHLFEVNQVVIPVKREIKDLLGQDEETEEAEHEWIKVLFATPCSPHAAEENEGEDVEEDAGDAVRHVSAVVLVIISSRGAPICYNAEGQEVAIRAQKQVDIYSRHVMKDKFVDDQVNELCALEANQPFDLRTPLNRSLIVDEPADHKLSHNGRLDTNPHFLDVVAGSRRIVLVHFFRGFVLERYRWHVHFYCSKYEKYINY